MLCGLDLTSQLVSVLIRFWVGSVDILANTKAMLYQVEVLEKQRSFLLIYGETVNYRVCTHLFGTISFLSSRLLATVTAMERSLTWEVLSLKIIQRWYTFDKATINKMTGRIRSWLGKWRTASRENLRRGIRM